MLLHTVGGNRQQAAWDTLAQPLQEQGFAVLSFDFRGHGDSRNIRAAEFWSVRANLNNIKGATKQQQTIDHEQFLPGYLAYLVNDIAAAKVFLEEKNNAKECNAGELYIVAAEDGAGLGLVWTASEWLRRKLSSGPKGRPVPFTEPEGKELGAVVCLSLRDTIGRGKGCAKLPTSAVFRDPNMRNMPTGTAAGMLVLVGATRSSSLVSDLVHREPVYLIPTTGDKHEGVLARRSARHGLRG